MSSLYITPMGIEDVTAVTELARQLGYPSTNDEIQNRFERMQKEPGNHVLVARATDGTACGWIHLRHDFSLGSDPRLEVAGLVVDEKVRGQGIGAQLMAEAEKHARAHGLHLIRLRSNTSRAGAHRFYERLGYAIKKTSHLFVKEL
jgi:GNAT superfamily N-acetyltransferase